MTTGSTQETDMGVGVGLAFGLLAVAAAAYTFVAPGQFQTALGFAGAVTLSALCVAALHVWG
ncbi:MULTISPECIES: hypothetical protein [Halobacterium]|jgi:hypothetical protein|uniref:Uncharacterized protein n=2 Tax=Halobacterium TaxID=2239 RepID=A0A0U5ACN3_9EURY|nr:MULTISPECIES: hypothetical protein [Halobacterium]MCD2199303.1 hypothetical protein [Halobacterium sp. KA-4]MCD2202400.1 hypothetical protein [Halobacterium sp. KA-6]MCG1002639.1 hypothetical protein [Halobacterium noricense]UHH26149.1 hypothetical protein LT974_04255 [Halobacterium noricense]CQH52594.1 uncharacterized protein HHUB_1862 [Halobacterium hubeiense]